MEIARIYRNYSYKNELKFNISYKETDIFFTCDKFLKNEAFKAILKYREVIENHILLNPEFLTSLKSLKLPNIKLPSIIKDMYLAGIKANVGPFASVAGAIAQYVAIELKKFCNEIVVENGGDIFIIGKKERIIEIKGRNELNIGIKVSKYDFPLAICSSSSKIGHSLSFGNAELVTVISKNGAIADAFATSICNKIKNEKDLQKILNNVKEESILGIIAILNGKIAIKGNIKLVKLK